MEKTIEYLQIKMGDKYDSADKTKVSKAELLDIITSPKFRGSHFLVNLQCSPGTKAYLLIDTGFMMTSIMKAENQDEPKIYPAPLFFYPLGLAAQNGNGGSLEKSNSNPKNGNGENMTAAQRRYIFRLLSEKKRIKGKEIEEYLKKRFNVTDIGDIDKGSASQLIDGLINGGE